MADPLSIAAGVAGLISLAIQTTEGLVKFYTAYKNQYPDVARTTEKLDGLLKTFQFLEVALQGRKFHRDERDLINQVESSIQQCNDLIQVLGDELHKFEETSPNGFKSAIKTVGRRTAYPFKLSTLQKLDEDIGDIRDDLAVALEVLQLRDHKSTQDDIAEVRSILEIVRAAQISSTIRDWLKAPDVTVNHNAGCAKRHPGTGMWLVKGTLFSTWLTQGNSFLWLNGFAGCGKSVLCSTAIQHAFRQKQSNLNVGIAFFYFSFSDESKQNESAMLRTLLLHLAGQVSDGTTFLARLHDSHKLGPPPPSTLIEYLRLLIQRFDHVYILIDALDESPRYEERDSVLRAVETMRQWNLAGLHLLVTSRDEPDIRQSFEPAEDEEVVMQNADIDRDIGDFISGYLKTELSKWQKYHDQIQKALAERAKGVFRWVECQFEALKRCPRSERHLNQCLKALPRDLDKTYERMLCNIDEDSAEEARKILTLLCFSARPLTVLELIDGIAVNVNDPVGLDRLSRLHDADSLREICPGLIYFDIKKDPIPTYVRFDDEGISPTVRIAHFSVQEYLESDRIRKSKAASYALSRNAAHTEIAKICCAYLLDPELNEGSLTNTKLLQFPFAQFSARFWVHHHRNAAGGVSQLKKLVLRIFKEHQESFYNWVKIYDVDKPWELSKIHQSNSSQIPPPEYYASLLGLDWVLHALLDIKREDGGRKSDLGNSHGGHFGNALQAASVGGHEKVIQMLLNVGAEVNAQGGHFGNALQAASEGGHEKVVQMLLDVGADVNAQGGQYGNALQAASGSGHEKVVQMLLDVGAEVNAQGGQYGNALQAASVRGHEKVIQMLLDVGAEVNAQGGYYGNSLQAASGSGHEKVVQMLLDVGADVNAQGGQYGNSLQVASVRVHEKVIQMLLDVGAEVNAQGGYYGNALQAASVRGHEKVIQMLLDVGAEVNAQGGVYGNALQAASGSGHEKVVQMLLDVGAEVNAQGGVYGNALQAASEGGHEKVVQVLLDARRVEDNFESVTKSSTRY